MSPSDRQLAELFELFSPSPEQIDRIEHRLFGALDTAFPGDRIVHRLAAEWLALLRASPIESTALVLAAAFLLLLTTPLALVPLALVA